MYLIDVSFEASRDRKIVHGDTDYYNISLNQLGNQDARLS
jgi:hypothetical protein